ncbi:MAG: DUF4876 domain-containing protein [Prevotella sp.]
MTKKILMALLFIVGCSTMFMSCSDNEETISQSKATFAVNVPADLTDATLQNIELTLVNVQTGEKTLVKTFTLKEKQYVADVTLNIGSYNVEMTAKATYKFDNKTLETRVRAQQNNVKVSENTTTNNITLLPEVYNTTEGFVISEVFCTQMLTAEGKPYLYGQYVIITNNSDKTLYADSLVFIQSADVSSLKHDYKQDFRNHSMLAGSLYMIPGTGKDVSVAAGKSIVIALNAENHTKFVPNAPDLTKANFEIYDITNNPRIKDNDNPTPNLETWFKESATISILHSRGVETYALARIPVSKEAYMKDYQYDAVYTFKFKDFMKDMTKKGYLIPNSWIIDAVNLGIKNKYEWNLVSPKIDAGFTYCFEEFDDKTAYGTAVIRRMENGKYVDTNNSTNDFTPKTTPSLLTK